MNKSQMINIKLFSITLLFLSLMAPVKAEFKENLFTDFNGEPREIADYLSDKHWTVVMLWASDCRICNREVGSYVDFNFKHMDGNARVLGISVDGQKKIDAAKRFIERHEVDFPNLLAEPERVGRWFEYLTGENWMGTPTILIYSPQGRLRAQQVGAVPVELLEKFIEKQSKIETLKARP